MWDLRAADAVSGGCEEAIFRWRGDGAITLDPYPIVMSASGPAFRIRCPEFEDLTAGPCGSRVGCGCANEAARTVASARAPSRAAAAAAVTMALNSVLVPVTLTPLGRRLAARPAGVRATTTLSGRGLRRTEWTIRLRTA